MYHQRLVEQLHHIQREHHPRIPSITAAVFDTALNFREAYLEYIPNYPIAAYRIEDEKERNPAFQVFHDVSPTATDSTVLYLDETECDTAPKRSTITSDTLHISANSSIAQI